MKFPAKTKRGIGALLCALTLLSTAGIACAADETAAPPAEITAPTTEIKAAETKIILRDTDEMRTIEVQSDRQETVAEFFARQKLSLVEKPNTDGKFWSVGETIKSEPLKFFASYPLDNDRAFAPYRFGAFYEMAPTSPTVSAFFQRSATPLDWSNTMLIVAPLSDQSDTSVPVKARIVGRVFIINPDKWAPYKEAETLKYQDAADEAQADQN